MTQMERNHPGQAHSSAKRRAKKTKKQFVGIEGKPEIYWIHADDKAWEAKLHLTGAPLVCPDPGCHQRMKASQRKTHPYTKYLSDMDGSGCSHFVPSGGGGRTTEEHLWLQGFIRQLCERLGYQARVEADYADIKVEAKSTWAVEVQRVSTDYAKREAQRRRSGMKTLWLLPESAQRTRDSGQRRGGDPVFRTPAVRLLYRFAGQRRHAPEQTYLRDNVWTNRRPNNVELFVAATLWTVTPDEGYLVKEGALMPLRDFLSEVFEGERVWLSRDELVRFTEDGDGWAGWVRRQELQRARASEQSRRERRAEVARRTREAERLQNVESERRAHEGEERRRAELQAAIEEDTCSAGATDGSRGSQDGPLDAQAPALEPHPVPTEAAEGEAAPAEVTGLASLPRTAKADDSSAVEEPWWRKLWKAIAGSM